MPEDITAEKALLAEEIAKATALLGDADVENNEDAKALKAAIDEAQAFTILPRQRLRLTLPSRS